MPTKISKSLGEKLGGKFASTKNGKHFLVECDKMKDLPNLELHFDDAKVVFKADDYSWKYNVNTQIVLFDICRKFEICLHVILV